jgi:hypothetical protein
MVRIQYNYAYNTLIPVLPFLLFPMLFSCAFTYRMIALHALQTFRGTPYRNNEKDVYINLTAGSQHTVSWAVTEGVTMEFCLARFWSTIEAPHCTATLYFRGVRPGIGCAPLVLTGGCRVSDLIRVENCVGEGPVDVLPACKVCTYVRGYFV